MVQIGSSARSTRTFKDDSPLTSAARPWPRSQDNGPEAIPGHPSSQGQTPHDWNPDRQAEAGKFEIKKKPGGQYHFVLKAANGEVIATSENYTSKASPGHAQRPRRRQ